ncbi:MAG: glycosyltransferase family 4 protein [Chloroflexi bacterium]|nr:glycosyltransferase family 4 protein [Chloroflexota bacterium]
MNVLMMGFDPTSLVDDPAVGDTRQRLFHYASELDRRAPGSQLHVIIRTSHRARLAPKRFEPNLFLYPANSRPGAFILDAYRLSSHLVWEKGVTLVTTQSPFSDGLTGYLLKRQYGIRLLVQLHTCTLDDPFWLAENRLHPWRRRLGLFVLRHSDGVRVVSARAQRWLTETVGLPPERVYLNPVSVSLTGDNKMGYNPGGYVLFVGGLKPEKDICTLLCAFALVRKALPSARMMVVGDGPEATALRRKASELGISEAVEWAGNIPYQQLASYYSKASVFVLPSVYESFGRVLIEALSFGVPVVSTDTEGGTEIVRDGITGFIVPRQDCETMAQRITYLLSHPAEAERMGAAGREEIRSRYDAQRLRRELIDIWFQVAAR